MSLTPRRSTALERASAVLHLSARDVVMAALAHSSVEAAAAAEGYVSSFHLLGVNSAHEMAAVACDIMVCCVFLGCGFGVCVCVCVCVCVFVCDTVFVCLFVLATLCELLYVVCVHIFKATVFVRAWAANGCRIARASSACTSSAHCMHITK
jgi:hypothetical protein